MAIAGGIMAAAKVVVFTGGGIITTADRRGSVSFSRPINRIVR